MAIINYFTTDMANAMRKQIESSVLQKAFPVNSYFISNSTSDPVNILGFGVWTRINGQFLYSGTAASAVGQTGGEATHTLTTSEMPLHKHYEYIAIENVGVNMPMGGHEDHISSGMPRYEVKNDSYANGYNITSESQTTTSAEGGQSPHNNMPPYYTTNIWRRVS